VHTCLINDVDHVPIEEDAWRRGLDEAERELGLAEASLFAGVEVVFLPARPRRELL
jgi:hypothetical protein